MRAGVTERTFRRQFPDKRDVLFGGGEEFKQLFVGGLASAPASAAPLQAVAMGLHVVGVALAEREERVRRRQLVIAASAELRERELVKFASFAAALAHGLRERGVAEPAASLTAETAIVVFRTAFERWLAAPDGPALPELLRESLEALQAVAAGG